MRSGASGIKRTHGPEGAPFSTGRLWRGIWRGVSRLSPRLVSAMWSAVSFVTVTVFVLGVSIGLIAVVVVSFCFFSLAFGVGSFSSSGGFVASVFSFSSGCGRSVCAVVSFRFFLCSAPFVGRPSRNLAKQWEVGDVS